MNVNQARVELSENNQKGVPVLYSAMFYWALMLVLGFLIDRASFLAILYLYGTGLLLPIGLVFSKMMGIDLFRKNNPLSGLSGIFAAIPAFMAPLLVYVYLSDPDAMPFVLAIITASHFFPFAWLYQSKAYVFSSILMMIASLLGIILWPEQQFLLIPVIMLVSLFVLVLGTKFEESKAWVGEETA